MYLKLSLQSNQENENPEPAQPLSGMSPSKNTMQEPTSPSKPTESSYLSPLTYKCSLCTKQFVKKEHLHYHIVMVHTFSYLQHWMPSEITENHLNIAIKRGIFKGNVIKKSKKINEYGCPHCPLKFKHWCSLKFHLLRKHHEETAKSVAEGELVLSNLKNQIISKPDSSNPKPYYCNVCPKTFAQQKTLQFHFVMVHTFQYLKNWMPPETTEGHLKTAISGGIFKFEVQSEDSSKFKCPQCPSTFKYMISLKYHVLCKHLDKISNEVANQTPYFSSSIHLNKNGWKPCSDYVCAFRFRKHSLKRNLLQLHNEHFHTFLYFQNRLPPNTTSEEVKLCIQRILLRAKIFEKGKPIGCRYCSSRFKHRLTLKIHLLRKHFPYIHAEVANGVIVYS